MTAFLTFLAGILVGAIGVTVIACAMAAGEENKNSWSDAELEDEDWEDK